MQGLREEMEDDIIVRPEGLQGFTFAAVFDGHGGFSSVEFLRSLQTFIFSYMGFNVFLLLCLLVLYISIYNALMGCEVMVFLVVLVYAYLKRIEELHNIVSFC